MATVVTGRADSAGDKTAKVLTVLIQRVRGTIAAAGVSPVSANEQGVPPEGLQHVLVLCVGALLSGAPNLDFLLAGEFGKMLTDAREWIKAVRDGLKVTIPDEILEGSQTSIVYWGNQDDTEIMTAV